MNEQITPVETQLARQKNFIGPPTEAGAAAMDVSALKRTKKKLITTIALTIDTCRWPLGDPADSDFHYCGELPLIGRLTAICTMPRALNRSGEKRPPRSRIQLTAGNGKVDLCPPWRRRRLRRSFGLWSHR